MTLSTAVVVGTLSNIKVSDMGMSARAHLDTPMGSVPIVFMGNEMVEIARQYDGKPVFITGVVRPWFSERAQRWFVDIQLWKPEDIRLISEHPQSAA